MTTAESIQMLLAPHYRTEIPADAAAAYAEAVARFSDADVEAGVRMLQTFWGDTWAPPPGRVVEEIERHLHRQAFAKRRQALNERPPPLPAGPREPDAVDRKAAGIRKIAQALLSNRNHYIGSRTTGSPPYLNSIVAQLLVPALNRDPEADMMFYECLKDVHRELYPQRPATTETGTAPQDDPWAPSEGWEDI